GRFRLFWLLPARGKGGFRGHTHGGAHRGLSPRPALLRLGSSGALLSPPVTALVVGLLGSFGGSLLRLLVTGLLGASFRSPLRALVAGLLGPRVMSLRRSPVIVPVTGLLGSPVARIPLSVLPEDALPGGVRGGAAGDGR